MKKNNYNLLNLVAEQKEDHVALALHTGFLFSENQTFFPGM